MFHCVKCNLKMRCKKNGVFLRIKRDWGKMGDIFECESCRSEILDISKGGGMFLSHINIQMLRDKNLLIDDFESGDRS